MKPPVILWVAVCVVLVVAVTAGLARAARPSSSALSPAGLRALRQLVDSAERMSKQAAQDADPMQQLCDAHFGLAYVNASRVLAGSDAQVQRATGVNIEELHATLRGQQRAVVKRLGG